jgi:hypothetical protein
MMESWEKSDVAGVCRRRSSSSSSPSSMKIVQGCFPSAASAQSHADAAAACASARRRRSSANMFFIFTSTCKVLCFASYVAYTLVPAHAAPNDGSDFDSIAKFVSFFYFFHSILENFYFS